MKYKIYGKEQGKENPEPVHCATLSFEEIKNMNYSTFLRKCRHTRMKIKVPCPNDPELFHEISLREAKHCEDEHVLQDLACEWNSPPCRKTRTQKTEIRPVQIPENLQDQNNF